MDTRYQVFVSSTFADLEEERKNVIQTLMEMNCIPAGMEFFPAIDEEQFEFIKAIEEYKRVNRRPFPTFTEVLEIAKALGYRKVAEPEPLNKK